MHHEFSMQLDWTALIQLGLFIASFLVLHYLVFRPYQALLHARHEKTAGLKEKAEHAQEEAKKLKEDYENFMRTERKKVTTLVDEGRRKIADEERTIIQTARDQVAAELGSLREKVKVEADAARRELTPQIPEYASLIASKLTGQKVHVTASKVDAKKGAGSDQPTLG